MTCDARLEHSAVRVYAVLSMRERNGIAKCGTRYNAKTMGMGKNTFARGIAQLIEFRHIERQGRSGENGLRAIYRLLSPVFSKRKAVVEISSQSDQPMQKVPLGKCGKCARKRVLRMTGWCKKCESEKENERKVRIFAREEIAKDKIA